MKISMSSLQSSNTIYNNRLKELKLEVLEAQLASKADLSAKIQDSLLTLSQELEQRSADNSAKVEELSKQLVDLCKKLKADVAGAQYSSAVEMHSLSNQFKQASQEAERKLAEIEHQLATQANTFYFDLKQDIDMSQKALKKDLLALENQLAANSSALFIELKKADKFRKLQAKALGAIISVSFVAGGLIAWLM